MEEPNTLPKKKKKKTPPPNILVKIILQKMLDLIYTIDSKESHGRLFVLFCTSLGATYR